MALSMSVEFKGIRIEDAYVRVASFSGNKSYVDVCVAISAGRSNPPVESRNYVIPLDLDGPNVVSQSYLHLKTLPEFAGATDC